MVSSSVRRSRLVRRTSQLLAGPTTYTTVSAMSRSGREMLMIEYQDGKPHSTDEFVKPEKVPTYPC